MFAMEAKFCFGAFVLSVFSSPEAEEMVVRSIPGEAWFGFGGRCEGPR